jgi:hypothetical protein
VECRGYAPPKAWLFELSSQSKEIATGPVVNSKEHSKYHVKPVDYSQHSKWTSSGNLSEPLGPQDADASGNFAGVFTSRYSPRQSPLPYAISKDYQDLQFYLEKVEPVISEVTPYQEFWGTLIPQLAWHNKSIRHLISAMGIAYKYIDGSASVDPAGEALLVEECNLAIREWTRQQNKHNSASTALVMSRIMSLINYTTGDFKMSRVQRRHGMRIARQTLADSESDAGSKQLAEKTLQMNLCGPGFIVDEDSVVKMVDETRLQLLSKEQQIALMQLKAIRHDFEEWMYSMSRQNWLRLPPQARHVILIAWGLMNRTIGSLFSPDFAATEAGSPFLRILEARTKLAQQERQDLESGEDDDHSMASSWKENICLHAKYKSLMTKLDICFRAGDLGNSARIIDITNRIQTLTNRFLVQASGILELSSDGQNAMEAAFSMDK